MQAIVQEQYGSPDTLALKDVDRPLPGPGQVLVAVRAASVNAADWHVMRGDPYLARLQLGPRRPRARIRGRDFAGEVVAVGDGVTHVPPGDEVYGETGLSDGAFAEYVCAPVGQVAAKPASLTFEQAAAVPLAGATALQGLRDVARLQPGQRLLVNGASGGVGTFAVQLGRVYDAHVTGVCSTRNVELVRSLGADTVVDYRQQDVAALGQRYDVVLDLVGNRSLGDLRRLLPPAGTLLLSGGGTSNGGSLLGPMGLILTGSLIGRFVRQRLVSYTATPTTERLTELARLADAGAVRPAIDRTFPLAEVPAAIRYLETEHARAKVVITVP
ncbi:NAD(P)-dependent alcohol dehydrogenase [Modestobacter sp. KNN46-3]|jgi:NADPH:quinone reductase-like Zn-dependent oxidoreductase|uniref:NAD(P)-dependent alcohol dehydrogenase n=1 Tax=Modestobacter sp. KNN46-3 TaxID=2711218 RepID=UPI0013DF96A1|nr:NAD(P)-dependent alcohol dehydrogenase [Modestobacter sp. KNN46-3]